MNEATMMTASDYYAPKGPCYGCGKPLLLENAWMEDGCPCNTRAGVNNHNLCRWNLLRQLQQRDSREVERLKGELATARRDALELAAKECDKVAGNHKDFWPERRRGAGQCAAAIRALKSAQPEAAKEAR